MNAKISIRLSEEILTEIDRMAGSGTSRSEIIERAIRAYLDDPSRRERDARELRTINRRARRLNQEALDTLHYQKPAG